MSHEFLARRFSQKIIGDHQHMAELLGQKHKDLRSDVVIVGGGFAGVITALKLLATKPDRHVVIVEAADRLAGHQTWTFQESELSSLESLSWLEPMIAKEWSESSYRFPRMTKTRVERCFAFRSEDLRRLAQKRLGNDVFLNSRAVRLSESHVELENDRIVSARCVLDARGLATPIGGLTGFQKSVGLEVELESPHGLVAPIMIDATCTQMDGLRYHQLLPWNERVLQVNEIYHSDSPDINRERITRSIRAFVNRKGWQIKRELREESRLLALPMNASYLATSMGGEALPIGRRGGYFHATLGNSFADTVRIAEFLAGIEDLTTQTARDGLLRFRRPWLGRQRYFRQLNRWLFYAAEPSLRYVLLQQFFEQREDVVERFCAGQTTFIDRFRITGLRPPVPFGRALRSFSEQALSSWAEARSHHSQSQPSHSPAEETPASLDHAS